MKRVSQAIGIPLILCVAATVLLLGETSCRSVPPSSFTGGLLTRAETSGFKATSRYEEVMSILQALDEKYPCMRLESFGLTAEGRSLPLAVLGRPLPDSPLEIDRLETTVVFINANIHAGEVEGKEACLMLIREMLQGSLQHLLEDAVILVAPIYNADGNERIDPTHRFWQDGPEEGVGIRTNAQCLDLNRDMIKLETPEARSMVQNILVRWDPHLVVDCHTTNGSYHREPITYAPPYTPLCDPELLRFNRKEMLPWITEETLERDGYRAIPYGNFKDSMDPSKGWMTFDHKPRYVTNYIGLRNRMSILIEMYAYATFEVRVKACYAFLHSILEFTRREGETIRSITARADLNASKVSPGNVPLHFHKEFSLEALEEPITIQGYCMEMGKDPRGRERPVPILDQPKDYQVPYFGTFKPADPGFPLPDAYIFPLGLAEIRDKLEEHGIQVDERREDFTATCEVFEIEKIDAGSNLYQGHRTQQLSGNWKEREVPFPSGAYIVSTRQALAMLTAYLLEPESDDGLACWNFMDRYITRGSWDPRPGAFPVMKIKRERIPPSGDQERLFP